MDIFLNEAVLKTIARLLGAIRDENDDMFGISYASGLITALVELIKAISGMDKDAIFMQLYPLFPTDVYNIEEFIPHDYEESYSKAHVKYATMQAQVVEENNS